MNKRLSFYWFFLGLGCELQLVASLSITELYVLISTPFIISRDYGIMKRTHTNVFFIWSCLVVLGAVISLIVYPAPFYFVIRRFALIIIMTMAVPFFHNLLRRDMNGIKWYFVGAAISIVLSTFIFKHSVEMVALGESTEEIVQGPIYWITRLTPILTLLPRGWYLYVPILVSASLPMLMAVISMMISTSGRSAALSLIGMSFLVLWGGKKIRTQKRVGRYFFLLCFLSIIGIVVLNKVYGHLAMSGELGEGAQKKYLGQTKKGTGVMDILIGGRMDSFVGMWACLDKPILGFGLMPMDEGDYVGRFLSKYGASEDATKYYENVAECARRGISQLKMIPTHSCVASYWVFYGLLGLVYWIYVIFVVVRFVVKDSYIVPQWYFWLVCGIPGFFWYIFFSPLSARLGTPLFIVGCLLARAVRQGNQQLPNDMIREIEKYSL